MSVGHATVNAENIARLKKSEISLTEPEDTSDLPQITFAEFHRSALIYFEL